MSASSLGGEPAGPVVARPARRRNPRIDQWKRTWYFLRRNTLALVGLGILVFFVAVAIYATTQPIPWDQLTTYCATNQGNGGANQCLPGQVSVCTYAQGTTPPHAGCYQTPAAYPSVVPPTLSLNPLSAGPLPLGSFTVLPGGLLFYSVYDGLMRGIDYSLVISITIVAGGALMGTLLGSVSGYFGGLVDETIMRLVDIMLSIPQLLLVIMVVSVVSVNNITLFGLDPTSSKVILLILAFLITWWPFYTRIVRGQVLVVREQKFVEAARASGAKKGRIILRHIMPNSVYPVFIQMSLDVGTVPLLIAALIFLGFRLFPTQYFPEWGTVAALSVQQLPTFLTGCQTGLCVLPVWQLFIPGLALFLYAISVNFFADGIRDALDPRLRR